MKNKAIIITAVFLSISLGSYFGIIYDGSIRTVEYLSILATGALAGVLLVQVFKILKNQKSI